MTGSRSLVLWAAAICVAAAGAAQASRYEILYRFGTPYDALLPEAPVLVSPDGTIYGTTEYYSGAHSRHNVGTIFSLSPEGQESRLWHFNTRRHFYGISPEGNLIADPGGAVIGATQYGGSADTNICPTRGCGVVFSLQTANSMTILKTFGTKSRHHETFMEGLYPAGGLIEDPAGNLYGATVSGGDPGCVGASGRGCGVVYELKSGAGETVLHAFTGGSDGFAPSSTLLMDGKGNLYGTTKYGGAGCSGNGCGAIFKVAPDGETKILYSFTGASDGQYPTNLIFDRARNLFGTAQGGSCCGIVFKLAADGTFTTLYEFSGGNDGSNPVGQLAAGSQGRLYGTTSAGGSFGLGTVFKIERDGSEKVLHSFGGGSDGSTPKAGLTTDASGNLYGTTEYGGRIDKNGGTVFRLTP